MKIFIRVLTLILISIGLSPSALAQQSYPEPNPIPEAPQPAAPEAAAVFLPDTTRYRGFDLTMPFTMGALYLGNEMEYYHDSLHLDWTFNYGGPASIMKALDSANWRTTDDGRWRDRLDAEHYERGMAKGVRFIYAPGMIGSSANATVAENYFGYQSQYTVDRVGIPVVDSMQALWPRTEVRPIRGRSATPLHFPLLSHRFRQLQPGPLPLDPAAPVLTER